MTALYLDDRRKAILAALRRAELESAKSLTQYLGHVVIDRRPNPVSWGQVWEPWQGRIVRPLIPALEYMTGHRKEYDGPRRFMYVMPRGHDKTSLIARLCNWALGFSRNPITGVAAASDLDQARILLSAMNRENKLNPWLASRNSSYNYVVRGPGGLVEVVSSDAPSSSGYLADLLVCDEIVYWKDRTLFDMLLSGLTKRPQGVFIVITNAGIKETWQHEIFEQCQKDPLWHVYSTPEYTHLASWMSKDEINSDRDKMTASHALRVYDNVWTNVADRSLLSPEMIRPCKTDPKHLTWKDGTPPPGHKVGDLYIGYDVGRTRDLSVLTILEKLGDVCHLRYKREMAGIPFEEQWQVLDHYLSTLKKHIKAARIDKGGIGMSLAEKAETKYPRIAKGIACGSAWQGKAAVKMQVAFRTCRMRIPEDDTALSLDLQQVEETDVSKGGMPVLTTSRTELGHADRFWSLALALDAVPEKRPTKRPGRPVGKT